jgi:2-keto-4-pentenoate hydratase
MVVDLQELARRMLADYDARTPGRLFSEPLDLTTVQAYALQAEIARLREQRGEKVIGYKVGCTSPAVQHQLGIGEPIFARIFDTGCFPCGAKLSYRWYANLAVEGELAVRLGQAVPASSVGVDECRTAVTSAFPVIELHHYVLRSPQPSLAELIAGGGMHAGFVLAEEEPEVGLPDLESLSVWIDDQRMGRAAGADVTGLAVRSVRWLADRLAERGLTLARGQVVLTGSLLPLYALGPGSRVVATVAPFGRSSALIGP